MSTYNLCIIHQIQEAHIFNELVGAFSYGLNTLGHTVYTSINAVRNDAVNIILAAHISPASVTSQLPANSIIFNTEQVGSIWMTEEYLTLLRKFKVWDYSAYNATILKTIHGIENVMYNPVGYCPLLERIKPLPEKEKDIDILLYGSINQRRRNIMEKLSSNGLKTTFAYDAFGEARDNLIARSKIILNIHYWDTAILETIRLSYLLNNKCFIITEQSKDWKRCEMYWYTMVMSDYNWLVEDCMEYVNAPKRRENVAECGYALFKENKQESLIHV